MSDWHVIPVGDLKEHISAKDCHCQPYQSPDQPKLWIHNSFDGRELLEFNEEELSQATSRKELNV
jgi:hypothetical protein